jgi:hypothetical protein
MRLTSNCMQRWLASWVAFTLLWCGDYVLYWITHDANVLGIFEFFLPLLLLLLLCAAYAEVNGEGQRMLRVSTQRSCRGHAGVTQGSCRGHTEVPSRSTGRCLDEVTPRSTGRASVCSG